MVISVCLHRCVCVCVSATTPPPTTCQVALHRKVINHKRASFPVHPHFQKEKYCVIVSPFFSFWLYAFFLSLGPPLMSFLYENKWWRPSVMIIFMWLLKIIIILITVLTLNPYKLLEMTISWSEKPVSHWSQCYCVVMMSNKLKGSKNNKHLLGVTSHRADEKDKW